MEILDRFRALIEQEIREILLEGGPPHDLATLYCYQMGLCDQEGNLKDIPKGKYMRPSLCLVMCGAFGGKVSTCVPAAASLEMIHRTSLIFDDIQDHGRERNQRPTVWATWGRNQAINAGLALSSLARLALHRLRKQYLPHEAILNVNAILERAVVDICWGQYMDISMQEKATGLENYLRMIRGKTAALFGAACEVGALVSFRGFGYMGAGQIIGLAREFGIGLGIAFQMHDDYLGIWGDDALVGKTANDLVEKKMTLPVVLALETDPDQMRAWLSTDITPDAVSIIRSWMETKGILSKVREMEESQLQEALGNLQKLPIFPEWEEPLINFVKLITRREW